MATSSKTIPSMTSDFLLEGDSSLLMMEALRNGTDKDDIGTHQTMAGGTERGTPAISSSFANGTLSVVGGKTGNTIEISRNAAGAILVNDGAVSTTGGTPTIVNTSLIQVSGNGGDDVITLDEAYGALPRAILYGGTGHDLLAGGSGDDQLFGQADNDTLLGRGGVDFLYGGAGNDVLTGGDGNDQMFGEAGNDRMVWNPGDDSDLMEGGDGIDTAEVSGGNGAEVFTATANGTRVRVDRLDPAPFALDIGTTENLVINMNGGDDTFSTAGNLSTLIKLTVDGGTGNDTILGGNGADVLMGGDGDDFIDGQQGNDVVTLGAGNDVFQWDPGDGNDTVDGQHGSDTVSFNGSAVGENIGLAANGERLRITRNVGTVTMDVNDVERVDLNALGGTDTISVGDLSGTDVSQVNVNLAGAFGGTTGDALADTVSATGTSGGDLIDVFGNGTSVTVVGLRAQVNVSNSEGTLDSLVVNGGAGNDSITASTLIAGITKLTIDGGVGNDTILGSAGADMLLGGDGDDFIDGQQGNDVVMLGAGNDIFQWDPGDGSDTVEGQDGTDTLLFNGSNVGENISLMANGGRATFFRDIAAVTMDLNDVEVINYRALGGADNIVVGDLSGTDVTQVNLDLRGSMGGPDGELDSVTVNATQGDGTVTVSGNSAQVMVTGPQTTVTLSNMDASDQLTINGLDGADVLDATGLVAGAVQLTMNGGLGVDTMVGGAGGDLFNGGDGNDIAHMGAGDDTFVWNPGDDNDILEGQAGTDTLVFNGANVGERITISANGGRATFFRDVATVTTDLNDVEHIVYNAAGGADNIVVNDLSGTDVTQVAVNLGIASGTGDAAADTVTIDGTDGDDVITLSIQNGALVVDGLASQVVINGFESGDTINIRGLGGNDIIDASAIGLDGPALRFEGGDGDDILVGGQGADVLLGDAGNDVVLGGAGLDVLDGGLGENIVLQDGGAAGSYGMLSLSGGVVDDTVTISRNAAGQILSNGVSQGNATVVNTALLRVFGKEGSDTITLNEANGALPSAMLYGGTGNDLLAGGSGADQLFGQADNDTLLGRGGVDFLYGGAGNDVLTGGDGNDQMLGEAGDDRMVWNPGDDSDVMEGGTGIDTAEVIGGGGAEVFTATANGTRVRLDRLDPAPFALDIGTTENMVINMNGGDDTFSATGDLASLIGLTVDGGTGNDTILGSNGADVLMGGDGNDFIDGQQGTDVVMLGAGDDVFQWDPGDGNDTVEGQDGTDTLSFNGSNIGENIGVSANGGRATFFRNVATVTTDLNDVERIVYNAQGGADSIVVNDLSGTDVTQVAVNLAAVGGVGDLQPDNVYANGTAGDDVVELFGNGSAVNVIGLASQINVTGTEGAYDTITIYGHAGADVIDASAVVAGTVKLVLDGGDGSDVLIGSDGDDVLIGGAGDDVIIGGGGNDVIIGGEGDDIEIQDFVAGAGTDDQLDLSGRGISFEWLMAHASEVDGNAVFDLGTQKITLDGVSLGSLHQDDFLI